MTGTTGIFGMLVVGLLLAGCSGDGGEAREPADGARSSSETASEEPRTIEVEECRTAIGRADAIASEMETTVIDDASQFTQMFDRLMVLQKQADSFCSDTVYGPLSKGIYALALANAGYTTCDFVELCNKSKIERDLIKGTGLIHKAATRAERTT